MTALVEYICNLGDTHEISRPPPHPKGQHRHGCYSVCPERTDEELIKSYGACGVDGIHALQNDP